MELREIILIAVAIPLFILMVYVIKNSLKSSVSPLKKIAAIYATIIISPLVGLGIFNYFKSKTNSRP